MLLELLTALLLGLHPAPGLLPTAYLPLLARSTALPRLPDGRGGPLALLELCLCLLEPLLGASLKRRRSLADPR